MAALALPGLAGGASASEGDGISIEYHHYEEGKRDLYGQQYRDLKLKPLTADSLSAALNSEIIDRVHLDLRYSQDTWSGATPITTLPYAAVVDQIFSGASQPSAFYENSKHQIVAVNWDSFNGTHVVSRRDARLVHVMASASPETRRQVEGKLGYEWDDATLNLGGGLSREPDYTSNFVNAGGTWSFDRKLTTLTWSASYTWSHIQASLEANTAADWGAYIDRIRLKGGVPTLLGRQKDYALGAAASRVLSADEVISANVSFTQNHGFLSNPYKATILAFDDPDQFMDSTGLRTVVVKGSLEQRPDLRNQLAADLNYVRYIAPWDAALHVDYKFFRDSWNITAHTLDVSLYQPLGDGWMLTPGIRYYTQSEASFYQPYFLFNQAFPILFPRNPELPPQLDHSQIALKYFSSDERLSAFGDVSGSLVASKQIFENAKLELGVEFSRHAGGLKLGGHGEGSYADFNAYSIFSNLSIDTSGHAAQAGAFDSGDEAAMPAAVTPAGVLFDRVLAEGKFSAGVRYSFALQDGHLRRGTHSVSNDAVANAGCGTDICSRAAKGLYTHIASLDLAYAPADWLTLVLTPQFADVRMTERPIASFFIGPGGGLNGGSEPSYRHTTGGLGDTLFTAVHEIVSGDNQSLVASLGVSAPTASVSRRFNLSTEYLSYPMQLGSGTWDAHPAVTYSIDHDGWSLGTQMNAVLRLQARNDSGYRLGNGFEASVWAGYGIFDWLAASLRGVYSVQGRIGGAFKDHIVPAQIGYKVVNGEAVPIYEYDPTPNTVRGPFDLPANSGGSMFDVGLGFTIGIPAGRLVGNRIAVEWLQPVYDDVNGYQPAHSGTLNLRWDIDL